jgi:TonB family protein
MECKRSSSNVEIATDAGAASAARDGEEANTFAISWSDVDVRQRQAALENYTPSVRVDQMPALNANHFPVDPYLKGIHERIHPIFALDYLPYLEACPTTDPRNDQNLRTRLELVLSGGGGALIKAGVIRSSAVKEFDAATLETIQRASPFGAAPSEIVSADGNVYLHWEFHRNPIPACSTYFARVYQLQVPSK